MATQISKECDEEKKVSAASNPRIPILDILQQHPTYLNIESNRQLRLDQNKNYDTALTNDPPVYSFPHLSKEFRITDSIQNVCNSKISEVKFAFNHAAYCLLRAALVKKQKEDKESIEKLNFHISVNLSEVIDVSSALPNPDDQFDFQDDESDVNGKFDMNTPIISEILKRARDQQKEEDDIEKKKQKLSDDSKKKQGKAKSSSTKKTGLGVILSASSTKASSSMVDSRATVARAILCAAASIAFAKLTPDLSNVYGKQRAVEYSIDEDDSSENQSYLDQNAESCCTIDPLNVPQNIHYKMTKNNNVEYISSQENQDEVESSTNTKLDNKDDKDKDELNTDNNTKKTSVNMGAVMMQAKILGNRAVSYALAAARRSRERHKFVVDSAMQQQNLEKRQQQYLMENHSSPIGCISPTSTTSLLSLCIPNPFGLSGSNNTNSVKMENEYSNLFDRAYDPPYPVFNDELVTASKLQSDRNYDTDYLILTEYWRNTCLSRMKEIISTGMGNMIYHDMEWTGRAHRIADFLRNLAMIENSTDNLNGKKAQIPNFGPHLIVASENELRTWEDAFPKLGFYVNEMNDSDERHDNEDIQVPVLRALSYTGNSAARRKLRRHLKFIIPVAKSNTASRCSSSSPSLVYTKDSQFHVVVTSYKILIRDFVHLCQIPWQVVTLDDGMGWLGASQHDPNGKVGRAWDGLWSKADGGIGMAGAYTVNSRNFESDGFSDFCEDDDCSVSSSNSTDSLSSTSSCSSNSTSKRGKKKKKKKNPKSKSIPITAVSSLIGLTARHRILIASTLTSSYRGFTYPSPVPVLLSFLVPSFSEVTREEWDRSRVYNCTASMKHYRGLLARSVVTFMSNNDEESHTEEIMDEIRKLNQVEIAKQAMEGMGVFAPENHKDKSVIGNDKYQMVTTDQLMSGGKFMQSRRFAVAWLTHNLREEFAGSSLDPILDSIQKAGKAGYVCEEVVVAPIVCSGNSSNSGNSSCGSVWGGSNGGFRCAIRCGRIFTSEQGLRQHLAALHAPPGTWLCRSCGGDCGTSQARTHHERYCASGGAPGPNGGSLSTVGQIGTAKQHGPGVGKQSGANSGGARGTGSKNNTEKVDKDGSFRVPGYRGVWINPAGKNFIKIKNEIFLENCDKKLFDTSDEAAKFYDQVVKERDLTDAELNYKDDGETRIVYDDKSSMASAGRGLEMLGGGTSSVVPALSVINIKDLPKHVKPLLRDPKQTSRTGGNSKRFVYAYRGVCRQARKGHDRWQSQISFGGTNHYLGTFDSEWDAAAIYAWAHLILYGEEATQKAQREGEEAAAAWEQEKKDIAAGIIVVPIKPVRKKKVNATKSATGKNPPKKRQSKTASTGKKTGKKQTLMTADHAKECNDKSLTDATAERILACRSKRKEISSIPKDMALCVPIQSSDVLPSGWAVLIGLSSAEFNWGMENFLSEFPEGEDVLDETTFDKEYGLDGTNAKFRCTLQGTVCHLGRSNQYLDKAFNALGLGQVIMGPAGKIDCVLGGPDGSCSDSAARIDYCPTGDADYHFSACNDDDVVTLNGLQIKASMGSFPIRHEDICSVGPRVFIFITPNPLTT